MKIGEDYSKKTALDDSASIYQKREERTEKQKLAEMTGKQKFVYLREYYLKTVLIILFFAALAVWILVSIFRHKPDQAMSIIVIDNFFSDNTLNRVKEDFTKLYVEDEYEEEIQIDTDYYYSSDEYQSSIKFSTRLYAGEIDLIIARKSRMIQFCGNNIMHDLSTILTPEEMNLYGENIIYANLVDEDPATGEITVGDLHPYAIALTNLNNYNGYDLSGDPLCIAVCQTAKDIDESTDAVSYWYNYQPAEFDYGIISMD